MVDVGTQKAKPTTEIQLLRASRYTTPRGRLQQRLASQLRSVKGRRCVVFDVVMPKVAPTVLKSSLQHVLLPTGLPSGKSTCFRACWAGDGKPVDLQTDSETKQPLLPAEGNDRSTSTHRPLLPLTNPNGGETRPAGARPSHNNRIPYARLSLLCTQVPTEVRTQR